MRLYLSVQINGTPVETASHNDVVKLIKKSGDPLMMKVVHVDTSGTIATSSYSIKELK